MLATLFFSCRLSFFVLPTSGLVILGIDIVKKTTSENLCPRINQLKPREAQFSKKWFSFVRRQPQNLENLTSVASRRKHFRGFWAIFLVAQLPPKRYVFLVHKN